MADLVSLAIGVLLLIIVVLLVTHIYNKSLMARVPGMVPWTTEEHPQVIAGTKYVFIWAVCPGEERLELQRVLWNDPDFESKIEEARCEAQIRLAALNSPRQLKH